MSQAALRASSPAARFRSRWGFGGGFGVVHELAEGVEDDGEFLVVVEEFAFEGVEFGAEVGVGGEKLAEADEGAHDLDGDGDGGGAAEDGREHGDALFGEGVRTIAKAAPT